jgi:hypothetical protein
MAKWVSYLAAFVLIAHGLIHLMGTTVYLRLGEITGFAYKTTLLGGRWDVGGVGIGVFGAMWAVAAVGFFVAAIAMLTGLSWWQPTLMVVTIFSLVLTGLDSRLAFAGVIMNIVILGVVFWSRRPSLHASSQPSGAHQRDRV